MVTIYRSPNKVVTSVTSVWKIRSRNCQENLQLGVKNSASSSHGTSPTLIQKANSGQSDAWNRLVSCYQPTIVAWCRERGLDAASSDDVTQETLLSVAQSLPRFKSLPGAGAFRAWMRTIVKRRIADHQRMRARFPLAVGGTTNATILQSKTNPRSHDSSSSNISQSPGSFSDSLPRSSIEQSLRPSDRTQVASKLKTILDQIEGNSTSKTWLAFQRSVVDGRPTDEIADELQMTPAGVRQIRSRILRQIRKKLILD